SAGDQRHACSERHRNESDVIVRRRRLEHRWVQWDCDTLSVHVVNRLLAVGTKRFFLRPINQSASNNSENDTWGSTPMEYRSQETWKWEDRRMAFWTESILRGPRRDTGVYESV